MRYAIFDFTTGERTEALELKDARNYDSRYQCRISQATTVEDERFLGDSWTCNHCLDPWDCTSCNPNYHDAYIATCRTGNHNTWHHADGTCLYCNPRYAVKLVDEPKADTSSDALMFVLVHIPNMMRMWAFSSYDEAQDELNKLVYSDEYLIETVPEDEDLFYSINS